MVLKGIDLLLSTRILICASTETSFLIVDKTGALHVICEDDSFLVHLPRLLWKNNFEIIEQAKKVESYDFWNILQKHVYKIYMNNEVTF